MSNLDANRFPGFRSGDRAASLPAQFFTQALPLIDDEAELRFAAYALYVLARPRAVRQGLRLSELAADRTLDRILARFGGSISASRLAETAAARGILVLLYLSDGDAVCFPNSAAGRRARDRVAGGAGRSSRSPAPGTAEQPTPAAVYEREIGLLTPAIAEALAAAVERFSAEAVVSAIHAAARYNARRWSYVLAVLEGGPRERARPQLPEGIIVRG